LLSIWALLPPIAFWVDWVWRHDKKFGKFYTRPAKSEKQEQTEKRADAKADEHGPIFPMNREYYVQGYELARNGE
jgi:hypothetical protein